MIPIEIHYKIHEYLNTHDLVNLSLTCKEQKRVTRVSLEMRKVMPYLLALQKLPFDGKMAWGNDGYTPRYIWLNEDRSILAIGSKAKHSPPLPLENLLNKQKLVFHIRLQKHQENRNVLRVYKPK